jgi:hypothetical protein
LEREMHVLAEITKAKAMPSSTKLRLPLISPKANTPHKAPTSDGPVEIIGKEMDCPKFCEAKKNPTWAIAHTTPDAIAGTVVWLKTCGEFRVTSPFTNMNTVAVKKMPQK